MRLWPLSQKINSSCCVYSSLLEVVNILLLRTLGQNISNRTYYDILATGIFELYGCTIIMIFSFSKLNS